MEGGKATWLGLLLTQPPYHTAAACWVVLSSYLVGCIYIVACICSNHVPIRGHGSLITTWNGFKKPCRHFDQDVPIFLKAKMEVSVNTPFLAIHCIICCHWTFVGYQQVSPEVAIWPRLFLASWLLKAAIQHPGSLSPVSWIWHEGSLQVWSLCLVLTKVKNPLPIKKQTKVVYWILCSCGKAYIGETWRRLQTRIKEHQDACQNGTLEESVMQGVAVRRRMMEKVNERYHSN